MVRHFTYCWYILDGRTLNLDLAYYFYIFYFLNTQWFNLLPPYKYLAAIMAPSAIEPFTEEAQQTPGVKPARLYPVKEAHFESFLEPQPDGYQQALAQGPGNAAIVIDNGNFEHSLLNFCWEIISG